MAPGRTHAGRWDQRLDRRKRSPDPRVTGSHSPEGNGCFGSKADVRTNDGRWRAPLFKRGQELAQILDVL